MAKMSEVDRIVAEMTAEKRIVDFCIGVVEAGNSLEQYSATLAQCIARLTNGSEPPAPKPTRTRKSRKATEPSI